MQMFKNFRKQKRRKNPIQRDAQGKSLRARCFARFTEGQRPAEVASALNVKPLTVLRYFRDWQRRDPLFDREYAFVKALFKKSAPERDANIEKFATLLGITREQLEDILSQPHGLKRLLTGRLYFPVQAEADRKYHVALMLGVLISEHLVNKRGKFVDVYLSLVNLMNGFQADREAEDQAIEEVNEVILLVRKIIQADLQQEGQKRVQPQRLSVAERNKIIEWGQQSEAKQFERWYWLKIGQIMSGGLTMEQAREKIYQDQVSSGNIKTAEALRRYQNIVHPLTKDNPSPG
jgi:hypothetical protein